MWRFMRAPLPAFAITLAFLGMSFSSFETPYAKKPIAERHENEQRPKQEPVPAWPAALNEFFGTNFTEPTHDQILGAMIDRLNHRTVQGVAPAEEFHSFKKRMKRIQASAATHGFEQPGLERLYRNLADYIEIEADFSMKPRTFLLERMKRLVKEWARHAPDWDTSRTGIILEAMDRKRQLVPPSILFGRYLSPYRSRGLPAGTTVLEIPVEPQYRDRKHSVEVYFDLLAPQGPVCRLDFEAVGAESLLLEESHDGRRYRTVLHTTTRQPGGLRAPIFVEEPFRARYAVMRVTAPHQKVVFRSARLFGLKETPAANSPRARSPIRVDGVFDEAAWVLPPQVYGFVARNGKAFARVPSTVRLCNTREALYFAAYLHDDRPRTVLAAQQGEDEPLWERESLEIQFKFGTDVPHRFVVGPLGSRYDNLGTDAAPDGRWESSAAIERDGWTAEISIPFATLGRTPSSGEEWHVNFIRNRVNVLSERSAWAVPENTAQRFPAFGTLAFE